MLLMRSLLFVPANRENMVARAHQVPADVIVLDLEDSVPPAEKEAARNRLAASITSLKAAGKTVHVRVNGLETGLTRDDLDAAIGGGAQGLCFPKAEGAHHIREADVLIREQEMHHQVRPGTVVLIPQIESARALLRCEDIATTSSRIAGLSVGGEDYTADLAVARTPGGAELAYARGVIVNCCVAYRMQPLDVIYPVLHDEAGLTADATYAKSVGFKGKYLIHPEQVEPVNRIFSPSADDVAAARRVVEAFEAASARGEASVQVDGRMVDIPVAKRARDLIVFAEAISAVGL